MNWLGIGSYRLADEECYNVISTALKLGYRHIDTAKLYKNEESVGRAIRDSGIARSEIWVTTKIHRTDIKNNNVVEAITQSLEKLDIEYIDLVLLHQPYADQNINIQAWQSLTEYYLENKHKIKHIGVSNYGIKHLTPIINCKIKPYCNQIELSPFFRRQELVDFCGKYQIKVVAHSCLTNGEMLDHHNLQQIANKYQVSSALIILAWIKQLQLNAVVGANLVKHLSENLDANNFKLQDIDLNQLNEIDDIFYIYKRFKP